MLDYFDRVFAINLDRRPDRWSGLVERMERAGWPFRPPERVSAVDGDATTVPTWWKQGGGAWGCMMSHARILEDALRSDARRILILEDDATFVDGFAARAAEFLAQVPADWDQLYFGGQHLIDPDPVGEHVFRCHNVNRTHAHAVSRAFMPRMYRHILEARDYIAFPGHHVDHRLGALHETGTVQVFAPVRWLVGQGADRSDISGRETQTLYWNTWRDVPKAPMVVILGLHCGDAAILAGLLRERGVHFGHQLGGGPPVCEDRGLADICERAFPFPTTDRAMPVEATAARLHDWCTLIQREAADYGTCGAACYPHLCAMADEFGRAWPTLKVVDVRLPLEEAIRRLRIRSRWAHGWLCATDEQAADVQGLLDRERAAWYARHEVFAVDAEELHHDPRSAADRVIGWLETTSASAAG